MKQFWHDIITDKSFYALQSLRKEFDFVLIGGWAVFLYTRSLKSKDIDMIVDLDVLSRMKTLFNVTKNERLKKYEVKLEGFDVDIYIPFWSELGLPLDFVSENTVSIEGFKVPVKEILLTLKLFTFSQRKGTLKGRKDAIDVISLLYFDSIDFKKFGDIIKKHNLEFLKKALTDLLDSMVELEELMLNQKQYADFKKKTIRQICD